MRSMWSRAAKGPRPSMAPSRSLPKLQHKAKDGETASAVRNCQQPRRLCYRRGERLSRAQSTLSMSKAVEVKVGDTIDFVIDHRKTIDSDEFLWAPAIVQNGGSTWDARKQFRGPIRLLTPWEQLAQVLFMANEFLLRGLVGRTEEALRRDPTFRCKSIVGSRKASVRPTKNRVIPCRHSSPAASCSPDPVSASAHWGWRACSATKPPRRHRRPRRSRTSSRGRSGGRALLPQRRSVTHRHLRPEASELAKYAGKTLPEC